MNAQVRSIYSQNTNENKHTQIITYALILIGLGAVVYFGFGFFKNVASLRGASQLSADVYYDSAQVYLNDKLLDKTPQDIDNVKPGENTVVIKGDNVEYEVTLNFMANSQVVINRDLGVSQAFSAGQNFWLEKSDGGVVLNIISDPVGANVFIDGSRVGQTPYSSSDISQGDYDLRIEYPGYESQTARIEINPGFKLNVSASLFPVPVPQRVDLLEGSATLYDIYTDSPLVVSDLASWSKAVAYWNRTRGINLAGVGVNKEQVFDFYLDFEGNLYNDVGIQVAVEEADFMQTADKGAYLRRLSDGEGLSERARETYLALSSGGGLSKKALILDTGTGWLRVRGTPSLNGAEVARVDVGQRYTVLEQNAEWVKIQVSEGLSGWVSSTYARVD
jgi:hypothetical protein